MAKNEIFGLAAMKQAALQNVAGIWPVRGMRVVEGLLLAEDEPVNESAPSAYPGRKKQLHLQSNNRHLTRTGKIERKLEALRLMRQCDYRTSGKE